MFDYFASAVKKSGSIAWQAGSRGGLEAVHSVEQAWAQCQAASAPDAAYVDIHAWRQTPASFRLIVSDLRRLGLLELGILIEVDTVGSESFVSMRRDCGAPAADRMSLAIEIGRELAAAAH